ncbi:MAG: DUF3488 domain-containing protein [Myxococcales bacterium]|jgi:hypothetical protein|nr:DUF3488 domain-containing protein [Myxococcales bacterium]
MEEQAPQKQPPSIWWYAFGYFAVYAPYTFLTKLIADGKLANFLGEEHGVVSSIRPGCVGLEGCKPGIDGLAMLPLTGFVSMVGMFIFLSVMGWWKYAGHRKVLGLSLPCPSRWTFLSGLGSAVVIATTTLSYTFGISIVVMMLFMRGGMLVMAPIVDLVNGRKPKTPAVIATVLSILAISAGAFLPILFPEESGAGGHGGEVKPQVMAAVICVICYLAAYFLRMSFMSKKAKSDDPNATYRYFVEEQMTSTPALVLILGIFALIATIGGPDVGANNLQMVKAGFTLIFSTETAVVLGLMVLIGMFSQGNGIFGGLILLDKRDNTFCVPVNRASSVLAGVISTLCLWAFAGGKMLGMGEIVGALLLVGALCVLSAPSVIKKMKAKKAAQASATSAPTAASDSEPAPQKDTAA